MQINKSERKSLTFEELGELLFDILLMKPEECLDINLNSGRYDQRDIKLKPVIDITPYHRFDPVTFKNHGVKVIRQSMNNTRVTFKNAPLNNLDEEILNLCSSYGKPSE